MKRKEGAKMALEVGVGGKRKEGVGGDRSAIYSPISSGKKFLHTKGLTFRK